MSRHDELAAIFERDRPRLRRIAHRMLGDWDQADEAVQESWLKTGGIGEQELRNAGAWLTTITTRVCLDKLRQRRRRTPAQRLELDDPKNAGAAASLTGDAGPEHAALTADSIGVALLIVLERLGPLERVAFVLHDVFALPFEEIAGLIDRSPETARQLASRARRKVRAPADVDGATLARHRELAEAFLHAARTSDMAALLRLLDPDVVATADAHAARQAPGNILSGAERVAGFFAGKAAAAHVALVNGDVGIVVAPGDRLLIAVIPRFANGRITHLHAIAAPEDLAKLEIGL